jgi:3-methylfumaryl-CoA hydratase
MTSDPNAPTEPVAHDLSAWIGRTETVHDTLAPTQAMAAAAMLDRDQSAYDAGAGLPALWHWFYFLPRAPQMRLAADGHPERGGFLPPVPLPRRMFAGARIQTHRPLILGLPAVREGTIANVTHKSGKSGALAFVTVRYRFTQGDHLCIEEEQDIVYREQGAPVAAPVPAPLEPLGADQWQRTLVPDTRMLFRFSALTFNAHRIHYDRPYAMHEEGYPGLVVHGPLIAVLLADFVTQHRSQPITGFSFKGLAPLFDGAPVRLEGTPTDARIALAARAVDGTQTMSAHADLGPAAQTVIAKPR